MYTVIDFIKDDVFVKVDSFFVWGDRPENFFLSYLVSYACIKSTCVGLFILPILVLRIQILKVLMMGMLVPSSTQKYICNLIQSWN